MSGKLDWYLFVHDSSFPMQGVLELVGLWEYHVNFRNVYLEYGKDNHMEKYRVRVGKKGELYLPKALRQKTRIKVNSEVEVRIERDRIIIDVIPSLEDLLSKRKTVKLTPEEFEEISEEVQREIAEGENSS